MLALVLTGCSSVFGIDYVTTVDAGTVDAGSDCSLTEAFDGAKFDTTNWNVAFPTGSAVEVSFAGDELHLTIPVGTTANYNGLQSTATHDVTGHRFGARVIPGKAANVLTEIRLAADVTSYVTLNYNNSEFRISVVGNGTSEGTQSVAYDVTTDVYWGIAFAGPEIRLDTSTNGTTWITRYTLTGGFDLKLDALKFEVFAGANAPGADATAVTIFDDISLCALP